MNNRDPFNVRRNSPAFDLLHKGSESRGSPAASPSRNAAETGNTSVKEPLGTGSVAMSFATSQNGATYRYHDEWQSSGHSRFSTHSHQGGGVGEKISGMFGGEDKRSLPMYKDKPYSYPGSRKRMAWFGQKRTFALALGGLAALSWWFGLFSSRAGTMVGSSTPSWGFGSDSRLDWEQRAEKVKEVFKTSFASYENHAWGADEYHPVRKDSKKMTPNGLGWIIIDALDTMMLMNLTSELTHARQWIHETLTYDQDHDVNTFETTIRMLGGLLSAHYLSTSFPGVYAPVKDGLSDDLYVEKATDLADRLLGAFETKSGVPLASVNLHTMRGIPSHADGGASSTAEATTVQLEMKYLAKLTGEDHYWDQAEKVMQVLDDNNPTDGLVPIFIYADAGTFRGDNIRLGSRGDSYYEYLIKQFLQTSEQEQVYQAMWNASLAGVKKHLITYSSPSNFTVLGERPHGLDKELSPKMDHLVCFMPGTIALATTGGKSLEQARKSSAWGPQQEEDIRLAEELMKTCWGMYAVTPTGLAGEITFFNIHEPPLMYNDFDVDSLPQSPRSFDSTTHLPGTDPKPVGAEDYIIKPGDAHNLQRPETVESLFYMWRITGDVKYRQWGWEMFQAFVKHTAVSDGTAYSSIGNVMTVPPPIRDNMESFWLAETLKYFYLLFSSNDILPLTDVVFNTEAHPFPRFEMGKLFTTGWTRKLRDEHGNLLPDAKRDEPPGVDSGETEQHAIRITKTLEREAATVTLVDAATPSSDEAMAEAAAMSLLAS